MGLVRDRAEVRSYDFQRPHQLSRLQLDAITLITESYIRVASNFLSSYLRTPVQIQHLATDQMPYERYADNVKTPTVLTVYTLNPYPGSALVECDPVLALSIIDRALGGPGLGKYPGRELTEIEQTIFRRVMDRLLELMRQSWGSMANFEPRVESVEYSPAFAQIAGESDLVIACTTAQYPISRNLHLRRHQQHDPSVGHCQQQCDLESGRHGLPKSRVSAGLGPICYSKHYWCRIRSGRDYLFPPVTV